MNLLRNTQKSILCISFASFWILANNYAWSQEDRVFTTKGGAAIKGKIVERTRDKVVIEVRGTNQNIPSNEVSRIVFEGEPQPFTRAKDAASQGQIDQAIDDFKKIDTSSIKTPEVKQDYEFFKGYLLGASALRGKGDAAAATKLLLAWVKEKENGNSNQFYAASEKLGELAMALGNPEQASKYFGAISNAPFPELKVRGSYLSGKALLALNQTANARAKFDAVLQSQVADPASLKMKKLASVATVRCDAADGKADLALQSLEKMVDEGDSTDAELFSELYNATGGILQAANKNEEAVLAYLKTDLLYSSQIEAHAEALFALSQLWPKIGDVQRGTEAKSRLSKLYPTSPWLKK